jgi:hypothetical protein
MKEGSMALSSPCLFCLLSPTVDLTAAPAQRDMIRGAGDSHVTKAGTDDGRGTDYFASIVRYR